MINPWLLEANLASSKFLKGLGIIDSVNENLFSLCSVEPPVDESRGVPEVDIELEIVPNDSIFGGRGLDYDYLSLETGRSFKFELY